MGFRPAQQSNEQTDGVDRSTVHNSPAAESVTEQSIPHRSEMGRKWSSKERAEQHFGMRIPNESTLQRLERNEQKYGRDTHEWIAEGMPAEIMGNPKKMEAFRQRQSERPAEVPTNIERQNRRSVLRSEKAAVETDAAGNAGVPEPVREVISSTGCSLDGSIQRAMEDRMGDSFGDVRIHTGPTAAAACESINARAFTVGNHIAFNAGEYDPESPEGQHVLAHELAHVRQQTEGAVSMLPQEDVELEVDSDPTFEGENTYIPQRTSNSSRVDATNIKRKIHIQRIDNNQLHHIFGQKKHDLDDVVSYCGSKEDAFEMMKENIQSKADNGEIQTDGRGVYTGITVEIGEYTVGVDGRIIDGTVRITTAYKL